MAGYIRGITIEFSADVRKLNDGLKSTQKQINKTQSELKQINTALKFKPGNTTLLKQKFDLLKKSVEDNRGKLKELKDLQKQMRADGVDETSAAYRELEREIVKCENQLKQSEKELKTFGSVGKQQALAVGQAFKDAGQKISSIGQTMTTKVTAPLAAGFTVSAKLASDYEENLNKIDVAFGKNADSVTKWAETASQQFGLSQVQATSAASAFGALAKGIGLSDADAASMSTTLAGLSADLGSYFNMSVDESSKALEGIFTGESEALKRFGVVMTDTNLKQFAADQGLVWEQMSQSEKTALRYSFVLEKTKDAQGDFARTSDGTANSLKQFQSASQDLGTSIGTVLLPIITPIIQKITELINKFNELSPTAQKVITVIGIIVAAIGPVLVIIGTLASSIGSIITLAATVGPVIAGVAAPILGVVAAIAAAVAIGVLLYKNWDKIKAKAIEIKDKIAETWTNIKTSIFNAVKPIVQKTVAEFGLLKARAKSIFDAIKNAITHPIETAKNIIKRIVDKIKSFFKFKISKPHIPLPHFSIRPAGWKLGDLLKGKIPSLGIKWYAQGGIFDSPTIAGIGEAGPEAVVPLNKLWDKLDNIASASSGSAIVVNVYGSDNMSVDQLATAVEQKLIQMQRRRTAAWA